MFTQLEIPTMSIFGNNITLREQDGAKILKPENQNKNKRNHYYSTSRSKSETVSFREESDTGRKITIRGAEIEKSQPWGNY